MQGWRFFFISQRLYNVQEESNMKICPQIYVRGSIEAVEFYKEAFNGTLGFHAKK
jgi:hypothetical protein